MLSWVIGDVRITRAVEFEIPVRHHPRYGLILDATPDAVREMPWLYPHFVTAEGHLMSAVQALLVEAPGIRLVVDTCVGNDKPRRMVGHRPLQTAFLQSLRDAGWPCESVQLVLCTHLHVDHVGWNTRLENGRWVPSFPNARYLIGRAEFDHWSANAKGEDHQLLGDSVQPILDAGLVDFVDTDHRISPEISLVPTPGHTPGHVSVSIESRGERALITGDVVHHPCQFGRPTWATAFDVDRSAAEATRMELFAKLADQPVLVIGTHFASPTAGRVRRDGDAYRFET